MNQDKLVALIVAARKKIGMNQWEASIKCGFSETYLGMIERKKRTPGPKALLRIMNGLGIEESVMREFLPREFHKLYEAAEPEYPMVRQYLMEHASSEELKKELLGTPLSTLEGSICEFLFDYWRHALSDGFIAEEDRRHGLVSRMVREVKEAGGQAFKRMLKFFDTEGPKEVGVPGESPLLAPLKEWDYDRVTNVVVLTIEPEGLPAGSGVYRLKMSEKGAKAGPVESLGPQIERVRRRAMDEDGFSELPTGLKQLIYDEEAFHRFKVSEEELTYLKKVELRGVGGTPTKEGYLLELEHYRRGEYPPHKETLVLGSATNPQLYEVVRKILSSDRSIQERIVKAIAPAVDAIIEATGVASVGAGLKPALTREASGDR